MSHFLTFEMDILSGMDNRITIYNTDLIYYIITLANHMFREFRLLVTIGKVSEGLLDFVNSNVTHVTGACQIGYLNNSIV